MKVTDLDGSLGKKLSGTGSTGGGGAGMSGDVSGFPSGTTTVQGIGGIPVDVTGPTDTYVITYDSGTGTLILAPSAAGSGPFIDVTTYGATGDGTTDDTTSILAAIADMTDGCTLFFPPASVYYKITSTLSITVSGALILGAGSQYGVRVHMATANTTAFSVIPSALDGTRNQTNLIRGLLITGPGSASSGRGVYASSDVFLENVGIAGFYEGLYWDSSTFYSRMYGGFITNCVRGVTMNGTNNCTLDTVRITGNFGGGGLIGPVTDGVYMTTPLSVGLANRIVNCSIEYFSGDGIRWNGGAGGEILGCYFETQQSSTGHAHINLGETTAVQALLIAGNYFQGDGTTGFSAIKGTNTEKITLLNNRFGINSGIGIEASGGGNSDWLLMNNKNAPTGTFTLPSTSYTLDPASPPASAPTFATPTIALGTAAAGGALTSVIRSDATIAAFDATVPSTLAYSDAPATGSAAFAARRDHVHGMPASGGGSGHWEVLMVDGITNPPEPLSNEAGDDWVYGEVA